VIRGVEAIIAVVGTLLGSLAGFLFQRRNAIEASRRDRSEKLRQERVAAYSAYGGALAVFRRSQLDRWFAHHDRRADAGDTVRESRRRRDAAREAFFRVQLLAGSAEVIGAGERALAAMDQIDKAEDGAALGRIRDHTYAVTQEFMNLARKELDRDMSV
jgi:hypothetical protein